MSNDGRSLELDRQVHEIGESAPLPYELVRALAWWVAAELIRRHPKHLRVIETHPGGGQYDCVSVYTRDQQPRSIVDLNLRGHLTHGSWFAEDGPQTRFNWLDVLAAEDRRTHVVEQLERVEELPIPKATPPTSARSIGPRVLSRFAATAMNSSRRWSILNGFHDSSGMWSGVNDFVRELPGLVLEPLPGDLLDEPAYRYWFVLDHEERPFTAIDVDRGLAWRRDRVGEAIDLMTIFERNGRRVDAVMRRVMPDVE